MAVVYHPTFHLRLTLVSGLNSMHSVLFIYFLSSADFFQNSLSAEQIFQEYIRVSNISDPDQARPFFDS